MEYNVTLTVSKGIVSNESPITTAKTSKKICFVLSFDKGLYSLITELIDATMRVSEPTSGNIRIEWDIPDAYFDNVLIISKLESTDSSDFFRDNTKNRPECIVGISQTFIGFESDEEQSFTLSNACPLSKYNFVIQTIKADFDPSPGFKTLLQTSILN